MLLNNRQPKSDNRLVNPLVDGQHAFAHFGILGYTPGSLTVLD